MGGVKSALKKRLQRDPTDAEISAEKQARREQTGPIRSVFSMQVIAGQKSAAGMHYMRAEGPFSEDEMIILHNGAAVVTMLDEVRSKAAESFPVGAGHGWQVFVGANVNSLRFVANQSAWVDRFEILHAANTLNSTSIFVCEVISKDKQSTLADVRSAFVAADLTMQATTVELEAAAKAAGRFVAGEKRFVAGVCGRTVQNDRQKPSPLKHSPTKRAGHGSKPATSQSASPKVPERITEDEEVAEMYLEHMRRQLENLVTQLDRMRDDGGNALFILTAGATNDQLSFVEFAPADLGLSHLDVDNGMLKAGALFLGCTSEDCKERHGGSKEEPSKLAVKEDSTRPFGKDGLVRLKSAGAIVGSHEHTSEAAKSKLAALRSQLGAKISRKSAQASPAAAKSVNHLNTLKSSLLKAAALSQAVPHSSAPTPAFNLKSPAGLIQPEAPASRIVLLRLPFAGDPMLVDLDKSQYDQVCTRGVTVGEDAFEVLREIERTHFAKRIKGLLEKGSCVSGDMAADRVLITKVEHFKKLMKEVRLNEVAMLTQKKS